MIEKTRTCDGACCKSDPLRPTKDGTDCFFRNPSTPEFGCTAMTTPSRVGEMTKVEKARFTDSCLNWPHNADLGTYGDWGGCCWRGFQG